MTIAPQMNGASPMQMHKGQKLVNQKNNCWKMIRASSVYTWCRTQGPINKAENLMALFVRKNGLLLIYNIYNLCYAFFRCLCAAKQLFTCRIKL